MNEFNYMFLSLKETLERDPDNVEALEKIWISVEVCRNYEESIALHLRLIDKKPYNSLAWYNLGHAYNFIGEYDKAIDALEYSFLVDPGFETGYLDCAEVCLQQQQYERAFDIYNEALERFGPDEEAIPFMIDALIHLDRKDEALSFTHQFLDLDPYNDELLFFAGELYREKGFLSLALKYYDAAISYNKVMETYHLAIAKTYEALGAINNAEHYYKEAAKMAPEENQYWIAYIRFLIHQNKPEAALAVLDKAEDYAVGIELDYLRAACIYLSSEEERGFKLLEELVREDTHCAKSFVDIHPRLKEDKTIRALLKYYIQD